MKQPFTKSNDFMYPCDAIGVIVGQMKFKSYSGRIRDMVMSAAAGKSNSSEVVRVKILDVGKKWPMAGEKIILQREDDKRRATLSFFRTRQQFVITWM